MIGALQWLGESHNLDLLDFANSSASLTESGANLTRMESRTLIRFSPPFCKPSESERPGLEAQGGFHRGARRIEWYLRGRTPSQRSGRVSSAVSRSLCDNIRRLGGLPP